MFLNTLKTLLWRNYLWTLQNFKKWYREGFVVSIYQIPPLISCYLQCIIRSRKFRFWFFFLAALQHVGAQCPNQGSNPCPLHWKHGVLTTGLPGKPPKQEVDTGTVQLN